MAVDHINAQGGIKALGGAKLKLVVLDSGDTTEKAKNAAQRMVAQETDLVAASGAYLSSFTLAVTEVTERASLPVLTLSYSDLITDRGFKYVFQTAATAGSHGTAGVAPDHQAGGDGLRQAAEDGRDPDRQHGGLDRFRKGMREGLLAENQLQLIVDFLVHRDAEVMDEAAGRDADRIAPSGMRHAAAPAGPRGGPCHSDAVFGDPGLSHVSQRNRPCAELRPNVAVRRDLPVEGGRSEHVDVVGRRRW